MRSVVIILVSLLGFGFFNPVQAAPPSPTTQNQPTLGDVNCDHTVNTVDALVILRHVADSVDNGGCTALADVNCDQEVNTVDALAILRYVAGSNSSGSCKPGQTQQKLLELKPGAESATTLIHDPIMGDVAVQLQRSETRNTPQGSAAGWSTSTFCQGRIYDVGTGGRLWSMTLNSSFGYNYASVWEISEWVSTYAVVPYSWSNAKWWTSRWSSTLMFADGIADLKGGAWWFSINVTKHIYIQQDAWGNCSFGYYNG